ncbi:acidic repeat-containing protein-like isoform X2 [Thrips palmi]|uniref:Acidic repeat-containing protein-like isoform X2 n=1 Tax=Thrips palmi TaxID=161013 RepID=A0A6P8ZW26_THRPL|nr:acidic repeat-containing protein-like isoform X2 [Thrips palmi]
MDPVLPFRILSPGSRKPKLNHRFNSKLSLKLRKGTNVEHRSKENRDPLLREGKNPKTSGLRHEDSDLMTSDESNDSMERFSHPNSVLSINTQESTFSLPVAESTRCEVQSVKLCPESTIATLHTASNGSDSSAATEYFTAYPLPVGCDESIVCISDSSPEPDRKAVASKNRVSESVLISSDESDNELPCALQQFSTTRKKLCDTLDLESSTSGLDHSDEEDIVIPPSVKSDTSSVGSSDIVKRQPNHDLVIPPSPDKYSQSDIISEDSCSEKELSKAPERRQMERPGCSGVNAASCDKTASCLPSSDCGLDESSWKEDFHLVLPDSQSFCNTKQAKFMELDSKANKPDCVKNIISKEKYDDIARWIIRGQTSSGDGSNEESSPVEQTETTPSICDNRTQGCPKLDRLPAARRVSLSSDSEDDNFHALIDSVRKNRIKNHEKINARDDSFNDGSFIDDDCRSDMVESPSFNVYHSDLTKSIRTEVKSVRKTVQSIKKKQFFRNLYHSDEFHEDDTTASSINKPKASFKSSRIAIQYSSGSEGSETDFEISTKGRKTPGNKEDRKLTKHYDNNCSDDSEATSDSSGFVQRKTEVGSSSTRNTKDKNIDLNDSDIKIPPESQVSSWRKVVNPPCSSSESSDSKSSKTDLIKKLTKKDNVKKPAHISTVSVTPKNIASLKSPGRPYSPIRTFLSSLSGPTHEPGVRDHPEAAVYNKNFKAKKEELTRRLFKLFNREVFDKRLPDDMLLEWNGRLVRTAGLCYCKLIRKNGVTTRTSKISLSTKVITSPDRLRDTLIHEMCHAAVWLLNNISGGHGPFWKSWAHKAMKRFPELPSIERCHTYNIETKFTYKCTKCGYSFGRHSKSLDLDKKRCGYCYGRFEVLLSSQVQGQNNPEKVMKTPRAPNAFALFVKENYGTIKQGNAHLKHGDIMKKLSENFACMKVKSSN